MALYLGKDLVSASSGLGVTIKNQDKTFTENGSYSADSGYTGLGVVTVDVQPNNQDKNITANGTYRADSGYTGLGEVTVEVPPTPPNNQDLTIKENGTYTADEGYTGLGTVTVDVVADSKIDELISRTVTEMTEKDFEGATSIGASAFRDCTSLVSVVIPKAITSIGASAFENCPNIANVYYKGTEGEWRLITIGSSNSPLADAHRWYYSENEPAETGNFWHYVDDVATPWGEYIEPVSYSEGLKYSVHSTLGYYQVEGIGTCTDTDIIIPPSIDDVPVKVIRVEAFKGCTNLTSVTIPDSVTHIYERAFSGCTGLTSIIVPNSVTLISNEAFAYCTSLTSVTIPDSVTNVGDSMFRDCSRLESATIYCARISGAMFSGCKALKSVTCGSKVKTVDEHYAFYNCISLEVCDFTACISVPILKNIDVFYELPSTCQIRVPASLYDEWIAATNWSTYASNIVAV